jgi:hypothetical protein
LIALAVVTLATPVRASMVPGLWEYFEQRQHALEEQFPCLLPPPFTALPTETACPPPDDGTIVLAGCFRGAGNLESFRREAAKHERALQCMFPCLRLPPFAALPGQEHVDQPYIPTMVFVPDGGTVLFGGLTTLREARNEFGPAETDAPVQPANRLFKNVAYGDDARSLMLMVTPRIIINEEEEERATGLRGGVAP